MTTYINPPTSCDICSHPITDSFVDGRTRGGPWGNMCHACHREHGVGLGTGRGQSYKRRDDGKFHKIEG